jgi:hypothetical protein
MDTYEAQTYTAIRAMKESRAEKTTEEGLKSAVKVDPRRKEIFNKIIAAKLQYDHLEAIKDAFKQRKDMLVMLCANIREELSVAGGISIQEKQFADERLKRAASSLAKKEIPD